jgi:hypothetical protein
MHVKGVQHVRQSPQLALLASSKPVVYESSGFFVIVDPRQHNVVAVQLTSTIKNELRHILDNVTRNRCCPDPSHQDR